MRSYEFLLKQLRSEPGLYLLGAGASAGLAPLGNSFFRSPGLRFIQGHHGLPPEKKNQSVLTKKIVEASKSLGIDEILPNREIRPGGYDLPIIHILERMPDNFPQLYLRHEISKSNFLNISNSNYGVFKLFYPSIILNYNHDGLASSLCHKNHRIIEVHGGINKYFGSKVIGRIIDCDIDFSMIDMKNKILMGVPETLDEPNFYLNGVEIENFTPKFVMIIGYSFAGSWENDDSYDDFISLENFLDLHKRFNGSVYIVDPYPDRLAEMISFRLKSRNIIKICAFWNVLSESFLAKVRGDYPKSSIRYIYEFLLGTYGSGIRFPIKI